MTVDAIVAIIDSHGFADLATADKIQFINDSYYDICDLEPWPFLEKTMTLTFNGSSANPTNAPTDLSIVKNVWYIPDKRSISSIHRSTFLEQGFDPAELGPPFRYFFIGPTLYFHPIPASTDTVTLDYIHTPNVLVSGGAENTIIVPKRNHDLLYLGALMKLFPKDDDENKYSLYERMYNNRIARMRAAQWTKQLQSPEMIEDVMESTTVDTLWN